MDGTPQSITSKEETIAWQFIKEAPHGGYGALLRSQSSTPKGLGHISLDVSR